MIDNYKNKLKSMLSEKRYKHSLGVCDEAVKLAEKYGADTEKAYTAGILHDCAKGYDSDEQIKLCQKYGVVLDDITLACKPVIHAPLGAKIAKAEYGVNDKDVLDAIMCHTVAKENMSLLDKIIYIADMIEPMRDFDGVEELRKAAYENIDRAFILGLKQSIVFNAQKNKIIHPNTLSAWNYMLMNGKQKEGH